MDSKERFTNRVDAYVAARPGYPVELLEWARLELGLAPSHTIADVGSGTGLLSRLWLDNGNSVIGVEPNQAMRAAGDEFLAAYSRFRSVAGNAEATSLATGSVDFITAGQAFHWFDPSLARIEFERIARPGCWSIMIWNETCIESTPLAREYEILKEQYGRDFQQVRRESTTESKLTTFFGADGFKSVEFRNPVRYTVEQFQQRAASSSYMPAEGDPDFQQMMGDLGELFARHVEPDGQITYDHKTRAFYCRIA